MKLTTDTELAEMFGLTVDELNRLRVRRGWPYVKLGRNRIRFTDEQIREIVNRESVPGNQQEAHDLARSSGLTFRSAQHHLRSKPSV